MVTIKDIYNWEHKRYANTPHPANLTPLQKIEWDEKNAQAVKEYNDNINRSFVGESLIDAPAIINSIKKK